MIIGVDCDDVLSETMKELLKTPFFTEKKIRWEDITSYNLREIPQLGLSREASYPIFENFFASEQYREMQPVHGAREQLTLRKAQGHQLVVITGRGIHIQEKIIQRVNQYFPDLFDDFLFANEASAQALPKYELCKQRGITLVIEDRSPVVKELADHGIPCFLLDKPRNQDYTPEKYPGVIKVHTRDEISL